MDIGQIVFYNNIKGVIIEILPIDEKRFRLKPLYRVKYINGNYGILEEKDIK